MKKSKFLTPTYELELLTSGEYTRVVGIDEVGRGCWAGPVAVGAYFYDYQSSPIKQVTDSKQLTRIQRERAYSFLSNHHYLVNYGSVEDINSLGIGKTIERLVAQIIEQHYDTHTLFLIDGQFAKDFGEHTIKIIRGDGTYYSIAAASIVAKVERDRYMRGLAEKYPIYGFETNVGYPARRHILALHDYGPSDLHRTSFKPIKLLTDELLKSTKL